ncbi:5'-nucleotidase SurE [Bacteroidales bacterium]|nr:5'-nucleotidase SurE [Bacteroidales bacterium]
MSNNKPLILITNDDGVDSKGIACLIEAVKDLGNIVVMAPQGPQSGMSSSITSMVPLRMKLLSKKDNLLIYSCNGTPVDCIKLAVGEVLDRKPDLILSGINHGTNSSICIHYSGTMGAAIEGCIMGIPSLGFSLCNQSDDADFGAAMQYVRLIAKKVLIEGLPKGICLNINVPNTSMIKGIKICSQAEGRWTSEFMKSQDALQQDVYWLTGRFAHKNPENSNSDESALNNGFVSVVPCKIDLTDYQAMETFQAWENETITNL